MKGVLTGALAFLHPTEPPFWREPARTRRCGGERSRCWSTWIPRMPSWRLRPGGSGRDPRGIPEARAGSDAGPAARALRDSFAARSGWNGRGVPGTGLEARAGRRGQSPAGGRVRGSGTTRALRARGERGRGAVPSQHPLDLRFRDAGRRVVRGHGASGGADAPGEAPRRLFPEAGGGLRAANRPGPCGCPREGRGPPRPEAREHFRQQGRPSQDSRLRPGEAGGQDRARRGDERPDSLRPHPAGDRDGNGWLHVAGAGPRTSGRSTVRHFFFRRNPLRVAFRQEGLQAGDARGHGGGDPQGRASGALGVRTPHLVRARPHRAALSGEGS